MVYNKFLKTLENLHIHSIESLGLAPDSFLHEPVSVQPVEDEALKGNIIKEFERGFAYEKGDDKRVIIASKVIV
ncbi:TPA: nucleotide exchange factor GrpE [Patescibacteria group bacterium]|nr:nucleotide exchange factor GrpE [Candidatus Gracilibacteria bacterium]